MKEVYFMPIIYDPLWKLLIDKKMKKTELGDVASLSSRTLSKLSKNKTVSTETLSRICKALHCSLDDVAKYVEPSGPFSFWDVFSDTAVLKKENALIRTYEVEYEGKSYVIYETRRRATKNSVIECRKNGTVYWVQYQNAVGVKVKGAVKTIKKKKNDDTTKLEMPLIKSAPKEDRLELLLIRGRPESIQGLDEGVFASASNLRPGVLTVLNEAQMKCLVP